MKKSLIFFTWFFRFSIVLAVVGALFYLKAAYQSFKEWKISSGAAEAQKSDKVFYCPMHPAVVQPTQGECPICHMQLVERKTGGNQIQLSQTKLAYASLATEKPQYRELVKEIHSTGTVEYDQKFHYNIQARVAGRVEKLYVQNC